MTQRIEVNVQTGERKVIDLTPEEIADAQARTEQEALDNAAKPKPLTVDSLAAALIAKGVLTKDDVDAESEKK